MGSGVTSLLWPSQNLYINRVFKAYVLNKIMKDKLKKEEILELFEKARTPEQLKKVKKKAMHNKIKLGELRKKFCKKCYSRKLKVKSIKQGIKISECENKHIMRWKIR